MRGILVCLRFVYSSQLLVNWLVRPVVVSKRKALNSCCSSSTAAYQWKWVQVCWKRVPSIHLLPLHPCLESPRAGAYRRCLPGGVWFTLDTSPRTAEQTHKKLNLLAPKCKVTSILLIPRGLEPRTFGLWVLAFVPKLNRCFSVWAESLYWVWWFCLALRHCSHLHIQFLEALFMFADSEFSRTSQNKTGSSPLSVNHKCSLSWFNKSWGVAHQQNKKSLKIELLTQLRLIIRFQSNLKLLRTLLQGQNSVDSTKTETLQKEFFQ